MLGDHQSIRAEGRTTSHTSKKIERARVLFLSLVRRIEIDDVHRLRQFAKTLQHGSNAAILEGEVATDLQRCEILPKRSQRQLSVFRKPNVSRSTTNRFNPNRPRPGVEIDKAATLKAWRKNIKKRLAQPVAGRTSL